MIFEYGLVLLVVPLAFVPKFIDGFVNLAGLVFAYHLSQFIHLLLGLEVCQQSQKVHLCCIQSIYLVHIYIYLLSTAAKLVKELQSCITHPTFFIIAV